MTRPEELEECGERSVRGNGGDPPLFTRFRNLLGAGPYLLLAGLLLEGLTVVAHQWIYFRVKISFEFQVIVTVAYIILCLSGLIWFNCSLNLIKVNLLDGKNELITRGPFNYVRHPLYATLLLTLPPLMIVWYSDFLFLLPWILLLILSHFVVSLEERGLIRTFGEAYEEYRKFVPALLPYKGAGGRRFNSAHRL